MARSRKSPEGGKEKAKTPYGLSSPPYSGKVGGNQLVIYVDYKPGEGKNDRMMVHNFLGWYAAKWYITRLIGDDAWEYQPWQHRPEDTCIITDRGIQIRMSNKRIKEVMDYEFASEEEAEWKDDQLARAIAQLKWGSWEHHPSNDNPIAEETRAIPLSKKELKAKRREEKSDIKKDKPVKERKPKIDKEGMLTAGDLASKLEVTPQEFRAALRKLKMVKPEGGWLFNKNDADDVMAKVKKELK
jgi:hypothetical protein